MVFLAKLPGLSQEIEQLTVGFPGVGPGQAVRPALDRRQPASLDQLVDSFPVTAKGRIRSESP